LLLHNFSEMQSYYSDTVIGKTWLVNLRYGWKQTLFVLIPNKWFSLCMQTISSRCLYVSAAI
jgi:hypothetical protein